MLRATRRTAGGPRPKTRRPPNARRRSPSSEESLIELRFRSDRAEDAFSDLLADPSGGVRLVACREGGRGSAHRLVRWIELETGSPAGRDRLRALGKRVGSPDLSVASLSDDRVLVRLSSPVPGVCAAVFAAGAICLSCPLLTAPPLDSPAAVRMVVPRNGEARRLRRDLERRLDGHLTVERTGTLRATAGLTVRQAEAFRTALEMGYFTYPRRADLHAVAQRLGVGRSTALELLRHAVQQLGHERYPATSERSGSA